MNLDGWREIAIALIDLDGKSIAPRTFAQPSTEIKPDPVTNNLDRAYGKSTVGLCPPIRNNPAPVSPSQRPG
jgi:hypothetical protein